MTTITYGMKVRTQLGFREVEARVREGLSAEGFGVLTEIDVAETLRAKLGIERLPYLILGACNPPLAAEALENEPDVGLLLPCNIVVYEDDDGGTVVAALNPATMIDLAQNPMLEPVAADARARLERVVALFDSDPEGEN